LLLGKGREVHGLVVDGHVPHAPDEPVAEVVRPDLGQNRGRVLATDAADEEVPVEVQLLAVT
jgi:hypothetical protein